MKYRLELIFDFEGDATIQTIEGIFDALEASTLPKGRVFSTKWEPMPSRPAGVEVSS